MILTWLPFLLLIGLWALLLTELLTGRMWGPGGLNKIARNKNPIVYWIAFVLSVVVVWAITQMFVTSTFLSNINLPDFSFTSALSQRLSQFGRQAEGINAAMANSACPVSLDETYGTSVSNPIRIGGGEFGGPLRTSAYLQTLRGPNDEIVSYRLEGYVPISGATLNAFTVTYPGLAEAKTLYFDHQTYVELKAPVGFRCATSFPIAEP
jgi:hypothetical protein